MYIVLRRDLWQEQQWPLGSIVSQGCHAATAALWDARDAPSTQAYCATDNIDSMRKVGATLVHMHGLTPPLQVTLEVKSEAQLHTLAGKLREAGLPHKLWVEQPENYATCLATAPAPRSQLHPFMKKLQLCKGWPHPST